MSVAVLLGLFAITLGWAVPGLLVGARWTRRAPRLAVATWQGLSVSMVLALLVAPVALVVAFTPVTTNVAAWLSACRMLLQTGLGGSGNVAVATVGLAVAGVLFVRVVAAIGGELRATSLARRRHCDTLHVLGLSGPVPGTVLLQSAAPAAYCLGGRCRSIVVTTAAVFALTRPQLDAVVAHERAHLAHHHHLQITIAHALARAVPAPLLQQASIEIAELLELVADDIASARHGRIALATALGALVSAMVVEAPVPALGAGGASTLTRVQRLVTPPPPLRAWTRSALASVIPVMIAVPLVTFAIPLILASHMGVCPVSPTTPMAISSCGMMQLLP